LGRLADRDRPRHHRDYSELCARKAPDDRAVQLGLAAHAFWEGESREAEQRLRSLVAAAPELTAAQAMLGELLVDGSAGDFLEWHANLPPDASDHPDIWYVRGLWARREDELRVAARCFWQAVRLAPTHRRATYQLGQVLVSLGEESGREFGERAEQLIRLTQVLDEILRTEGRRDEPLRRTAVV
jgi:predicted Zn-dependent protease